MGFTVLHFGSGAAFFTGFALVAIGTFLAVTLRRWWSRVMADLLVLGGLVMAALSSTPLPAGAWAALLLVLMAAVAVAHRTTTSAKVRYGALVVALGCWAAAVAWEWSYHGMPDVPQAPAKRLYVVGDSISAGIGREGGRIWPKIIAEQQVGSGLQIVDLSRGGATLASALDTLQRQELRDGMVLLEIGGNDLLGGAPAERFEQDLDRLLKHVTGRGRVVVMLELPLPPFRAGIGRAQRRLAERYGVVLVPKRYFATVFAGAGATLDGLHLSATGQERMARIVWGLIGRSLVPPGQRSR